DPRPPPAARGEPAEPRHRQADHRAAADEVPPGEPPGDEFVDDVLLNGSPSPPKIVKTPVVDVLETAGVHDTPLTTSPAARFVAASYARSVRPACAPTYTR